MAQLTYCFNLWEVTTSIAMRGYYVVGNGEYHFDGILFILENLLTAHFCSLYHLHIQESKAMAD